MKPENWIAIGSVVLTALVTAIGLYFGPKLTVKRAIEQFRSQKWWEKQCDTYSTLLESLSIVQCILQNHLGAIETDSRYEPSEFMVEKLRLANHEIEKHTAQGAYLLSDAATEALRLYRRDSDYHYDVDPYDNYKAHYEAAKACIVTVSTEAKQVLLLSPLPR